MPPSPPPPRGRPDPGRGDDPEDRGLVRTYLERSGTAVTPHGREALEGSRTIPPGRADSYPELDDRGHPPSPLFGDVPILVRRPDPVGDPVQALTEARTTTAQVLLAGGLVVGCARSCSTCAAPPCLHVVLVVVGWSRRRAPRRHGRRRARALSASSSGCSPPARRGGPRALARPLLDAIHGIGEGDVTDRPSTSTSTAAEKLGDDPAQPGSWPRCAASATGRHAR